MNEVLESAHGASFAQNPYGLLEDRFDDEENTLVPSMLREGPGDPV